MIQAKVAPGFRQSPPTPATHGFGFVKALLVLLLTASVTDARPPEIRNSNLRGLQIGATTVLTLDGAELLPAPRVFLGEHPIDAIVDPASTATRLMVSIPLSESVVPGMGALRLATVDGFSNSMLVGLDRFPQSPMVEAIAAIPAAVTGVVSGSNVSRTTFPGKAGNDLIIEVESKRLGSKLRPVIHVYDSRRLQIAWSGPANRLAGDARVVLKLPRDDQYTIEIHDAQYAPQGPSFFRLKVGHWQFADLAFPPAIGKAQDASIELLGNVPGMRSPLRVEQTGLVPVAWPNPTVAGGLPPSVLASGLPELVKTADQPMTLPAAPIAVSGRLTAAGQRDRFVLPVQPGLKLLLEVFAERIGSRIDTVLEIRNPQNAVIATNDDGPNSTDSRLEFTVPADLNSLELVVRDNLEFGGEAAIYRLMITRLDAPHSQFDVVVRTDAVNVCAGETQVLEAFVHRQAYDGPIQMQLAGLPAGVTAQGTDIPAGATGTLITFANNGETTVPLVTRIQAKSPDGAMAQSVRIESTPDDRSPPWMREQVAIAAAPRSPSAFQVAVVNEASLTQLVLASKSTMTVKLTRPPSMYGPVRLSLVTSQLPPRINGQPNLNVTIRAERAIEVPVDNAVKAAGDAFIALEKQHADAVKAAQAAQADAKAAAEAKVTELTEKKTVAEAALREAEGKAVYQVDEIAIIPSTLPESVCDLSIRAELLNPERNTVLRTAYTPVKRLPILNPLVVTLAANPLEATLDPATGAAVKLAGNIQRLAGYTGDVTLTFTGVPPGVSAPNTVVKADQTEFAIDMKIPANFAATEVAGVKLTAAGPADPLSGNLPVKSAEVAIVIRVMKKP